MLAQQAAIVVEPLDKLPQLITDPKQWLVVKSSFAVAIDDKLSSWHVQSTEADAPLTRVEKFNDDHSEMLQHGDVRCLPISDILTRASAAAQEIQEFKDKMRQWTLPCGVGDLRSKLLRAFEPHDAALFDVDAYSPTIEGLSARLEVAADGSEDKQKRFVKSVRDRFYARLCGQGVPAVLAKVM